MHLSQPFNIIAKLESIDGLLTVDEVAALLNLSKFTIYRMAQKRQIPCLMLGDSEVRPFNTHSLVVQEKEPAVAARQLKFTA